MHLGCNENPNSHKLSEDLAYVEKSSAEKGVGVFIDEKFSFDTYMSEKKIKQILR